MSPTQIMEDTYAGVNLDDTAEQAAKASAEAKEYSMWTAWNMQPITQGFLNRLDMAAREIMQDTFARTLAGSIDDKQLRARITEAAVLNQVIAASANGKYERLNTTPEPSYANNVS